MNITELDDEARPIVAKYTGEMAWPTVFLGIADIAAFVLVLYLAISGAIPLWLGMVLNSFVLYACQTPLHDAIHGAINGRDKRWTWLNNLIGGACGFILMHEFKMFRHLHTLHHTEVNDPRGGGDPDTWVFGGNIFSVLLRCLTTPLRYHYYFFRYVLPRKENFAVTMHIVLMYNIIYGIAFWLSVAGYWREVLMLWLIPHFIATAMIIFFFGYLVHDEKALERFRDSKVLFFRGRLANIIDHLWFFQDFHLIHHLYPRVPYYRYRKLFNELRPVLEKAGSPIVEMGKS
jgi:beta-carotene hydroxylase